MSERIIFMAMVLCSRKTVNLSLGPWGHCLRKLPLKTMPTDQVLSPTIKLLGLWAPCLWPKILEWGIFSHTVSRTVVTSRHCPVDVDSVCMRGSRIMMSGVLPTRMGHRVMAPSSLAEAYAMMYILFFFFPFLQLPLSTTTATQPVLSCDKREGRSKKRWKTREGKM